MDMEGKIYTVCNEDHGFRYRSSDLYKTGKYIILSTKLKLEKGNKEQIKGKMDEYINFRKNNQPLEYPNAGSTFKRGEDYTTAKLIDECGLKGYSVGGAEVYQNHAGFIINKNGATSEDVVKIIDHVKKEVYKKFNKEIDLEIQIIGEDKKE